jgi:hypothetical protein
VAEAEVDTSADLPDGAAGELDAVHVEDVAGVGDDAGRGVGGDGREGEGAAEERVLFVGAESVEAEGPGFGDEIGGGPDPMGVPAAVGQGGELT